MSTSIRAAVVAALIAAVASVTVAWLTSRNALDRQLNEQWERTFDKARCQRGELGPLCASRQFTERDAALNQIRDRVQLAGFPCTADRVASCVSELVFDYQSKRNGCPRNGPVGAQ